MQQQCHHGQHYPGMAVIAVAAWLSAVSRGTDRKQAQPTQADPITCLNPGEDGQRSSAGIKAAGTKADGDTLLWGRAPITPSFSFNLSSRALPCGPEQWEHDLSPHLHLQKLVDRQPMLPTEGGGAGGPARGRGR